MSVDTWSPFGVIEPLVDYDFDDIDPGFPLMEVIVGRNQDGEMSAAIFAADEKAGYFLHIPITLEKDRLIKLDRLLRSGARLEISNYTAQNDMLTVIRDFLIEHPRSRYIPTDLDLREYWEKRIPLIEKTGKVCYTDKNYRHRYIQSNKNDSDDIPF